MKTQFRQFLASFGLLALAASPTAALSIPNYDLEVTAITSTPAAPAEGLLATTSVTFTVTVRNNGTGTSPTGYNIALNRYLHDHQTYSASVGSKTLDAIAGGSTKTYTFTEASRPAGSYFYIVGFAKAAGTTAIYSDTNNSNTFLKDKFIKFVP
jgi:hypothetical protein